MKIYKISSATTNYIDSNGDLVVNDRSFLDNGKIMSDINRFINNKGHPMRGPDDCKNSITRFLENGNGKIQKDIYPNWVSVISYVLKIVSQKINIDKDKSQKILSLVSKNLGYTNDITHAGFILPNGRMINLSSDGYTRNLDHREVSWMVSEVDKEADNSTSGRLEEFMKITGAIRVSMTSSKFIAELFHPPTNAQLNCMKSGLVISDGECYIDCESPNKGKQNISEPKGTRVEYIIGKIRSLMRD